MMEDRIQTWFRPGIVRCGPDGPDPAGRGAIWTRHRMGGRHHRPVHWPRQDAITGTPID